MNIGMVIGLCPVIGIPLPFSVMGGRRCGDLPFVVRFVADRCFASRKALNLLPLYRSVIPRHATGQVGGEGDT